MFSLSFEFANLNNPFFVDIETTVSSTAPKKKAPKSAFHSPAGSSFFQKKKVVLGNVKHSGDQRDIFLSKSEFSGSIYSDVESLSSKDKNVSMSGINGGSLLGSAATTPKAKRINTGAGFGSPLGSPNFHMNDNEVVLFPRLPISLEKKWIDPKIIKTPVKVSIKKSFALDINLLVMEKKSMEMTTSLVKEKVIDINSNLKKQRIRSDRAVVIKKIPIDMSKNMIITAVAKKDSVHVAKAVSDHDTWIFRNWFRALLFTLPVGTTVHDLSTLLDKANKKTCTINQSLTIGNRVYYTVVGFESEVDLESAFCTVPVFGSVQLLWARLDLIWCKKCGRFGHSALKCDAFDVAVPAPAVLFKRNASGIDCLQLAKLYVKKNISIFCFIAFGGKLWAQVVSLAFFSGSSSSGSGYGLGFSLSGALGLGGGALSFSFDESLLIACLVSLKCSLKLLANQVFGILRKLSFVELVPMVPFFGALSLIGFVLIAPVLNSDMVLDSVLASFLSPPLSIKFGAGFNSSSSKILTTKIGGLESKMLAMKASFATCNVHGINVPAKQENIVHWHQDSGNLVLFIMEMKLRSSTRP
ncbi:hypothetical protein G9A89_022786 [Geosiphon pyriformis]|nr:hypothetical protein G9A89_022786 [Geosiphon pyriformis]